MHSFLPIVSSLTLGVSIFFCLLRPIRRRRLPFPPGPKGLPLIGNLWDVPAEHPWLTYAQWAATYGDVFYLDTPGNPTVVINSAQAAADIFEKRSGNYSDRPAGWGPFLTLMRYSNRWRKHRRMFHEYFQLRAVPEYYPVQMKATSTLLQQLLKSLDRMFHHVRYDQFVGLVDRALESIRITGNVGSFLVDYIPSLKHLPRWFPGTRFISLADAWRKDVEAMQTAPFIYASESLTVSAVLSAILAFLLYPEVQTKAQAEIDAAVGHNRLPNFDDRPQLPYINAIVLEVLRWNPVLPMGVAHRSVKEDVYRGYHIPAGTTVVEKDYPNPLVFDPNRFMPEDKEPQQEPTAAFGFGRRICPGRHLALNTAWIAVASMAATLSFSKATDPDGRVVEPSNTYTDGFVSIPAPFNCTIKARSAQAEALIDLAEL
ncbi:cytochrome P450 [Armillaria fumosa]|nr:cytochrome P450 [Armillaria fumosa]